MPAFDAAGKDLLPGDHVYIPATVAKIDDKGQLTVLLDHATHAEHLAHKATVDDWKKKRDALPVEQRHQFHVGNPCPSPPVQTTGIVLKDSRHVERQYRPEPGSPIFDKIK